jgi:Uma2 family endonuclease
MTTARRYQPHYTVEDYRQWEGRWELWAGVAVAMSPSPLGRHAKLLGRLVAALGNSIEAAGCAATVLVEIDWIIARDTVVRPDVTVVCGPEPEGHVEAAPALVFEVLSEATRDRDVVFKRSLYEAQGVPTYLIADPEQRTLHVLSLGTDGRYVGSLGDATAMPPVLGLCRDCQITLDPAWLFR